jgi:hypothetical protein
MRILIYTALVGALLSLGGCGTFTCYLLYGNESCSRD